MKQYLTKGLAVILLLFTLTSLFSQRPKVGVVLSGGGAKGLAHVGILKAIDSAGLKVDYITGTSMGSIIGAMYAAGYSGKQIEQINKDIDWDIMLSGKPQYKDVSMEERRDYNNYAVEVPMKNFKPVITTGMVESEEIYLYFNKIFFPYYENKDFTKMSIPFKCIATDLATGDAMVVDSGEVVKAIRASMAIPGVFESVTYGDKKYVDGGIIRNFPVTDCQKMGAEYIIGVNLFPGLFKVDELNNAMDVMYQITQYRDAADLVKEKSLCNMLIEPPLSKYSAGSFGDSKAIEAIGREVGKLYYPYFKALADSINALEAIKYDPEQRDKGEFAVIVDAISFEGLNYVSEEMLSQQLEFKPGRIYTEATLEEGVRKAYSSLYYKTIHYKLNPTTKGHANLHVMVRENELAAIKVALNYHSFTGAALMLNFTRRNLLFDKSKTMVKIALSENFRVYGEQKQFFGRKMSDYLSANVYFDAMENPIYEKDQLSYVYSTNNFRINAGYTHEFGLNQELRAGITFNRIKFEPLVTADKSYIGTARNLFSSLSYSFNTTDRRMFPRRGTIGYIEAGHMFNRSQSINVYKDSLSYNASDSVPTNSFSRMRFRWDKYYEVNEKLSLMHNLQASIDYEESGFYFDNSYLGGAQIVMNNQLPFYGYLETQINTSSFASALVGAQYQIYNEFYLSLFANIGMSEVYHKTAWLDEKYMKFRSGFSAQLGYNLAAFPIQFNFMYSPEVKDFNVHVSMGYNF